MTIRTNQHTTTTTELPACCALCDSTRGLVADPYTEDVWYCDECMEAFEVGADEEEIAEGD